MQTWLLPNAVPVSVVAAVTDTSADTSGDNRSEADPPLIVAHVVLKSVASTFWRTCPAVPPVGTPGPAGPCGPVGPGTP